MSRAAVSLVQQPTRVRDAPTPTGGIRAGREPRTTTARSAKTNKRTLQLGEDAQSRPPDPTRRRRADIKAVTTDVSEVESMVVLGGRVPRRFGDDLVERGVLVRFPLRRERDAAPRSPGRLAAHCSTHWNRVVEYRVCPIARWPVRLLRVGSSNTWDTRPMSLKTMIRSPLLTASPADSCPRCCSANKP